MMVPIRQSADVRRTSVLNAAIVEFARSGYAGTSTDAIATRAGISQPYLFRLFGTKKDLFIATYNVVCSRIDEAFVAAAAGLEGEEAMAAMGMAYLELLQDPDLLQVQLNGFVAAAADPDIALACQDTFRRLWRLVSTATGAEPAILREFFAQGMLCSVIAAIDLRSVDEPWAQSFFDEEAAKREALLAMGGTPVNPPTPADAGVA
jgi:AcrR family transcriptional regulator